MPYGTKSELVSALGPASQGNIGEMRKVLDTLASPLSEGGVADAETAHALNATFSDTEVEAALDALGAKINEIIAKL